MTSSKPEDGMRVFADGHTATTYCFSQAPYAGFGVDPVDISYERPDKTAALKGMWARVSSCWVGGWRRMKEKKNQIRDMVLVLASSFLPRPAAAAAANDDDVVLQQHYSPEWPQVSVGL